MVTLGLGTFSPTSRIRIPRPPQNSTTFIAACPPPLPPDSHRHRTNRPPAHASIKPPLVQELLDARKPHVAGEPLPRQSVPDKALIQLLDAPADSPLGVKRRDVS